tara:strand:- start:258 stop:524 length:267 start_codon:yes stop_codon:yes gene_type:complete
MKITLDIVIPGKAKDFNIYHSLLFRIIRKYIILKLKGDIISRPTGLCVTEHTKAEMNQAQKSRKLMLDHKDTRTLNVEKTAIYKKYFK